MYSYSNVSEFLAAILEKGLLSPLQAISELLQADIQFKAHFITACFDLCKCISLFIRMFFRPRLNIIFLRI